LTKYRKEAMFKQLFNLTTANQKPRYRWNPVTQQGELVPEAPAPVAPAPATSPVTQTTAPMPQQPMTAPGGDVAPNAVQTPPAPPAPAPAPVAPAPAPNALQTQPTEPEPEMPAGNNKVNNLTQKANNAVSANDAEALVKAFHSSFAEAIQETGEQFQALPEQERMYGKESYKNYIADGINSFFTGNDKSRTKKWISFVIQNAETCVPELVENGDPVATRLNILEDIATMGTGSQSYSSLVDLIINRDMNLWQAVEVNARKSKKADENQIGISLDKPLGEDGGSMGGMIADPKALRPEELVSQLSAEDIAKLHEVVSAFMSIPDNMDIIQEVAAELKFPNPAKVIEQSIQNAFMGEYAGGGDHARWMQFFVKYPQNLPPMMQQHAKDQQSIFMMLDKPQLKDMALQHLGALAQTNNEDLRTFVENAADQFLRVEADKKAVVQAHDLKRLPKTVAPIGKWVSSTMLLNYIKAKQSGSADEAATWAKYTVLTDAKAKMVQKSLESMLSTQGLNAAGEAKENKKSIDKKTGKEKKVLKLRYLDNAKNVLSIVTDTGTGEAAQGVNFENLGSVISPQTWVPDAMDRLQKLEPAALTRQNRHSKMAIFKKGPDNKLLKGPDGKNIVDPEMVEGFKNIKSTIDAQAEALHDKNDEKDPLNGWRKAIGKMLQRHRTTKNLTEEQLAQLCKQQKLNIDAAKIAEIEKGTPVSYTEKMFQSISAAMGLRPFDLYINPPMFDKLNKDDIADFGEQSIYAFKYWGKYMVAKMARAKQQNLPFFDPVSLELYLGLMRVHPQFSSKDPAYRQVAEDLYSLVPDKQMVQHKEKTTVHDIDLKNMAPRPGRIDPEEIKKNPDQARNVRRRYRDVKREHFSQVLSDFLNYVQSMFDLTQMKYSSTKFASSDHIDNLINELEKQAMKMSIDSM
jgi:transcriptional regulator with XRE-family HTH domain